MSAPPAKARKIDASGTPHDAVAPAASKPAASSAASLSKKDNIIPTEEVMKFIDGLNFTQPVSVLEEAAVKERGACKKCGRRRQYYCYDCYVPTVERACPRDVKLPVKVKVLLHHEERKGKATSVHAGVLSSDVELLVHPNLPTDTDPDTTLLVYPSSEAKTLDEMAAEGTLDNVKTLVFVDSTWKQSRGICRDEKVRTIGRHVQLNEYRTMFWRFQTTGDERFLATIEAIYYLLRDLHIAKGNVYTGQYDDLLYYYVHQYAVIQSRYINEVFAPRPRCPYCTQPRHISLSLSLLPQERAFTKRHQKAGAYIRKEIDFSYLLVSDKDKKTIKAAPAAAAEAAAEEGEDEAEKKGDVKQAAP